MVICSHCQTVNHPGNVACAGCGAPLGLDPAMADDPFLGRSLGGGRFVPQAIAGSGEIGMVYRGTDARTGQVVAIKIVHPDVAATHGDELLRAAGAVARLRHAKIATLLAAAREPDGTTFFVTEFVEGETLKDLLSNTGPLGARRAADILFQLCSALAPFHRAGRPHANLKPENVFLSEREEGDTVKIVDAGSPELFGVRETVGGHVVVGNPKYFSPEQALGEPVGLASDIFTLGIIGYQLLSGALPFFGATPDQLLDAIVNGTPTPVEHRTSGALPPRLAAAIRRCLAKRAADRFPDLRALATELAAVIKGAPAPPAPPKRRFGGGAQPSTVIADVNALASLVEDDEDRTVARELTDEALASLDLPHNLTGPERLEDIPEPLMFTGALNGDELKVALAQAAAASGRAGQPGSSRPAGGDRRPTAPQEAPPSRVAPIDPLEAAMAAAMAEIEGGAPPRTAPPGDLPDGGVGAVDGFDPFEGLASSAAPPPARSTPAEKVRTVEKAAAEPARPAPRLADAILDAMDDVAVPARGPAAAPLATAADFAAIAPHHTTSDALSALPPPPQLRSSNRWWLIALVVLVAGGGVWAWMTFGPGADDDLIVTRPVARRANPVSAADPATLESAAAAPSVDANAPPSAAVASDTPPEALLEVAVESEPVGAQVFEGETLLGTTPMPLRFAADQGARTLVFKLDGYGDLEHVVDPARVKGPSPGEAPAVVKVTLEKKRRAVARNKDGDGNVRKPPRVKNPYEVENPY